MKMIGCRIKDTNNAELENIVREKKLKPGQVLDYLLDERRNNPTLVALQETVNKLVEVVHHMPSAHAVEEVAQLVADTKGAVEEASKYAKRAALNSNKIVGEQFYATALLDTVASEAQKEVAVRTAKENLDAYSSTLKK